MHGVFGQVRVENEPPVRTDLPAVAPEPVARTSYKLFKRKLYHAQLGACAICEIELPFRLMTVDHIKPRSKGGTDAEPNLQVVCSHCNSVKGDSRTNQQTRARLAELEAAESQRELNV